MPKRFKPEFRAEAVRLVVDEGLSHARVARDLGVSETSISRWVQQARVDRGAGAQGALTTDEREELRRLRRQVRQLEMEREILKKATAFFARETQ